MNTFTTQLISLFLICFVGAHPLMAFQETPQQAIISKSISFETSDDLSPLIDQIQDQSLVLLGESSHGTSEFYKWRAEISRRLILEKGYQFVAVEGDWPAFSRINAYVKQLPNAPESLDDAMNAIQRWPLWMWRNAEFRSFVEWLKEHNSTLPLQDRVGLYGVDLYAKQEAMKDVITWLQSVNSDDSASAQKHYNCIQRFSEIVQYLRMVASSGESCREDLLDVLEIVRKNAPPADANWKTSTSESALNAINAFFNAEHNAKLVLAAEEHFRGNLTRGPDSWNARASHFQTTANRLLEFYSGEKGIIWAHNTHIGDARATDMGNYGMVNIGQLSREQLGASAVFAIGFGTYEGDVLAATQWEGTMERMSTPEAMQGSWEYLLANANEFDQSLLIFNDENFNRKIASPIPHRAIGVTFIPERERQNNYPVTVIPERYNAFIFIRETTSLTPLD
jgi:erythromycin esterase